MNPFNTPILFLIFNRPDTTEKVFEKIRELKPKNLYIAADGPRNEGEIIKCNVVKNIVLNNIDWDCNLKTLFREKNLGCKYAVSSAIDWFFDNVEEGIILEDDCLPHSSFFDFSTLMLNLYRDNPKIMHISGDNFSNIEINESYFFSKYAHIWGWATWKRAWNYYDVDIPDWPNKKLSLLSTVFKKSKTQQTYWRKIFDSVYNNQVNTWDYQWNYACFKQNGLAITPKVNLISNIGFTNNATHISKNTPFADLQTYNLEQPYINPKSKSLNIKNDEWIAKRFFKNNPLLIRIINKFKFIR
jgi:hypothetical protein